MRNLVEYGVDAYDQLARLTAAATDPDEVERAAAQLEGCLEWYDPRLDPHNTTGCGPVDGPGLLPAPHYTALRLTVPPPRYFFEVDDRARPFIMRVVKVEWVLAVAAGGP
jgi:hypothetical protein